MSSVPAAVCGQELIETQMRTHALAGVVTDPSGMKVDSVKVELHACTVESNGSMHMDDEVLARVVTDMNGKFEMPLGLHPKQACLSLRLDGFNPMLIGIQWSRFGSRMKIELHVAA